MAQPKLLIRRSPSLNNIKPKVIRQTCIYKTGEHFIEFYHKNYIKVISPISYSLLTYIIKRPFEKIC